MSERHPHHHDHTHNHSHETKPIISRRWQIATVLGNAAVGAVELAGGLAAAAYSVVADGVHNGADVYTYWLQSKNLLQRHKLSQEKQQRNRKIAHWVLCATSAGVAAKAGVDLAIDKESVHNTLNIYSSAASVAFNGLLFAGLYRGIRLRKQTTGRGMDHLEKDITKHFAFSDMPSAALALGGAYLQSKGLMGAEQLAAVASGALSAYVFRPTKKNLAHDHDHFGEAACGHNHKDHHHDQSARVSGFRRAIDKIKQLKPNAAVKHNEEKVKKPRWRRAAAALTSLAIIGGLMGESIANEDPDITAHSIAQKSSFKADAMKLQPMPQTVPEDIYECVTVEPGDSLWAMSSEQIEQTLGQPASNVQTNTVSLLSAHQTNLGNPDLIHAGHCVEMPTSSALEFLFTNNNLADEVNQLNTLEWDEISMQEHLFDDINQKLEQAVAA